MRGTRAKALRRAVSSSVPIAAYAEAQYAEVPHTRRSVVLLKDHTLRTLKPTDKVPEGAKLYAVTWTWRLANNCTRYFTQRFKRYWKRG